MSSFKHLAVPVAALAMSAHVHAQSLNQVVITATRDERPIERTLADVTTIDAEQISNAGVSSVTELLRSLGGIEIAQTGGAGSTSGIFVRGTKTSQTVVLVDGVRLENPTSGTPNLEFLPLSLIDHIEIVRGPMSSLYGSGAIGGVIQIFTRQGSGPATPTFSVGAGSQRTSSVQAGISGAAGEQGSTRYALSVADDRTNGYDATLPGSPNYQADNDGNAQRSATASLRQALGAGWEAGANLMSVSGRVFYDDAFSTPETARMQYRSSAASTFLRGRPAADWQTEFRVGDTRIDYSFDAFTFAPTVDSLTTSWQNRIGLPVGRLLFGLEQLRQRIDGEGVVTGPYAYLNDSRRTDSVFAGYEFALGRHLVRLQWRYDRVEAVGSEPTGTIAWGYRWTPYWLLRTSVGSAFRAPTFDDLYNPFGSNPLLKPEISRGAEAAIEYRRAATLFKSTVFTSRISDAIELDASFTPQNLDSARVDGVSFEAQHPVGAVSLRGSATFQDPRGERFDAATGEVVTGQLARRARHYASLGADWRPGPLRVGVEWVAQGPRVDSDGSTLAGYGVLNLDASAPLSRQWEVFGRLGNIGDKVYETAYGYRMPPRSLFVGVRYRPR